MRGEYINKPISISLARHLHSLINSIYNNKVSCLYYDFLILLKINWVLEPKIDLLKWFFVENLLLKYLKIMIDKVIIIILDMQCSSIISLPLSISRHQCSKFLSTFSESYLGGFTLKLGNCSLELMFSVLFNLWLGDLAIPLPCIYIFIIWF